MNVTELARQLKTTTTELFDKLPALGFDLGRRAIKVDDRIARRIIEAWRQQERKRRETERLAQIRSGMAELADGTLVERESKEIKVPAIVTVREFAGLLNVPVTQVLAQLMKNGVLTSINERIDFDTASIVGGELGVIIIPDTDTQVDDQQSKSEQKLHDVLTDKGSAVSIRPPVIVVMGHVDHGKTKILDSIRTTDVVSGESGGITQHIGAYQITRNGRAITFIDTPGHEAFTAMRSRGARVADVAILVVAADDGVQPQTKEAIKIIQDAKLPFVVAINKIDKPEANIEKVKQDLASINLQPEDWGGNVVCVPVSAKAGTGIEDLLETILLVADLDPEHYTADATRLAIGTIIESHIDKGEGPVATILVQAGTLRVGDMVAVNQTYYGKVRALKNHLGETVIDAVPGMPVKILGLKIAPEVGSIMEVSTDLKSLSRDVKQQKVHQEHATSVSAVGDGGDDTRPALNIIIKADVLGSAEAIVESLAKLETGDVRLRIVSKGLGTITEADVLKAEATEALLIGFHVKPTAVAANLARDKKVTVKYFEVIYHLIEDIQDQMKLMVKKEATQKLTGTLEVIRVFRKDGSGTILGGRVTDGFIFAPCETVIIVRGGEALSSGKINRIESGKQSIDKVNAGTECGVSYQGKSTIETGDILEFYQPEQA